MILGMLECMDVELPLGVVGLVEKFTSGAGEMAQRLRALTALPKVLNCSPKVLSSIPRNHMVAHNHLQWDLMPSSGMSEESNGVLIYIA